MTAIEHPTEVDLEQRIRKMRHTLRRLSWTGRPRRRSDLLSQMAELTWKQAEANPDSQLLRDQGGALILLAEAELGRWQGGSFPCASWVEDCLTERDQELLTAALDPLRQIAYGGPRRPALRLLHDALRPVAGGGLLPPIPVPRWSR